MMEQKMDAADPQFAALAACNGRDPEAWFPHPKQDMSAAMAVCARCPVRAACLAAAEGSSHRVHGIWGGRFFR